jgi:hypothetical protein
MRAGGREGGPEVRREGDGEALPLGKDAERTGGDAERDGWGRKKPRLSDRWFVDFF